MLNEAPYMPVAKAGNDMGESAIASPENQGPTLSVANTYTNTNSVKVLPIPFEDTLHLQLNKYYSYRTNY